MKQFSDKIKSLGKVIETAGNSPYWMNDDAIYYVTNGSINIFVAETGEDNYPSGSRLHLGNLTTGWIFTGFGNITDYPGVGIIAVGNSKSEVYRIEKSSFSELMTNSSYTESATDVLEKWIEKLLTDTYEPFRVMDYSDCMPSERMEYGKDTVVLAKERMLWLKHLSGSSSLMGFEDEVIAGDLYYPVSESIYLKTLTETAVECITTIELLGKDALWDSLEVVLNRVIGKLLRKKDESVIQEKERLGNREKLKEATLKKGVENLISILKRSSKKRVTGEVYHHNPVKAACSVVWDYLGIDYQAEVKYDENLDFKEQLEEHVRLSRVKMRKVILSSEWWKQDNGALIGFNSNSGEPVALIPVSPGKYRCIEPSKGTDKPVDRELASEFEPFAFFFYRSFPEKELNLWDIIRFGTFRNFKDLITVVLVGISGALLGLLNPYLTGILFDRVIPSASMSELSQMVYLLISATIAITVFQLTRSIAMLRFEGKMDRDLQAALWDRLLALPVPFFKDYSAGDLATRSLGIGTIRQVVSGVTIQSVLTGIFSVFYCLQLFYYNMELALIAILLGLLVMFLTMLLGYLFVKYQMPLLKLQGQISGMVLQFINGISKIRITGMEDFAFQFWADKFGEMKRYSFKSGVAQCSLRTFNSIFPLFASMTIFAYIVYGLEDVIFTVGDFAAFTSAYGQFQGALLQMGFAITTSLTIIPVYKRLKPILQEVPEVDESKVKPGNLKGNINLCNLSFRYSEDGPLIIDNLSLEIKSGEFVALVGQSGSGKSTLTRLLLGFETPETGSIFYDEQELSNVDIAGIRKQIGVVLQNSAIMQGSIMENIIGSTNLTVKDAWRAAEMAGIANDIKEMPMQMETLLTFGGGTLSGGQRQRVLIARALVRKPGIILFDEATSALDNRTQKTVSDSLDNFNVTRIVIAHRLSTIRNADKICFLDKGKIVEQGTFEELMKLNGKFAALANRQLV